MMISMLLLRKVWKAKLRASKDEGNEKKTWHETNKFLEDLNFNKIYKKENLKIVRLILYLLLPRTNVATTTNIVSV